METYLDEKREAAVANGEIDNDVTVALYFGFDARHAALAAARSEWKAIETGLPELVGEYLVTFKYFEGGGLGVIIAEFGRDKTGEYWNLYGTGDDDLNEVIAWQPLPKPFQRPSREGE